MFEAESKGYRSDILSYNAETIQLTKFIAERSLADSEEGDENAKLSEPRVNIPRAESVKNYC